MACELAAWMARHMRVMCASSEPGCKEAAMDQSESPGATVTVLGMSVVARDASAGSGTSGGDGASPGPRVPVSPGAEAGVASVLPGDVASVEVGVSAQVSEAPGASVS